MYPWSTAQSFSFGWILILQIVWSRSLGNLRLQNVTERLQKRTIAHQCIHKLTTHSTKLKVFWFNLKARGKTTQRRGSDMPACTSVIWGESSRKYLLLQLREWLVIQDIDVLATPTETDYLDRERERENRTEQNTHLQVEQSRKPQTENWGNQKMCFLTLVWIWWLSKLNVCAEEKPCLCMDEGTMHLFSSSFWLLCSASKKGSNIVVVSVFTHFSAETTFAVCSLTIFAQGSLLPQSGRCRNGNRTRDQKFVLVRNHSLSMLQLSSALALFPLDPRSPGIFSA